MVSVVPYLHILKKTSVMKKILLLLIIAFAFTSCNYKRVKGNGNITSETRSINNARKIKLSGAYDVELTQGPVVSLKIEGDDNILPYIITENRDGFLVIKTKDHINISTDSKITVHITSPLVEEVSISGSGNIISKGKLTGGDRLKVSVAGSGDVDLEVNTPKVDAHIAGSGNITIAGETKDEKINIAGSGDYKAENLKAENADVHIAGNGDVSVFADVKLDINIAGSGSVRYRGNAAVKQKIAGSGEVTRLEL